MTPRRVALAPLVASLVASSAWGQVSPAERFDRGVRLAAEGDPRAAMAEFRAAYEATQSPQVLFNIAGVHEQLNQYVEAEDALERYQRLARPDAVARHREEIVAALARLHSRIGTLLLRSSPPDVACTLDGEAVAPGALSQGARVSVGPHTVRCEAPGYEPATRTVSARGEADTEVQVRLARRRATLAVRYPLRGAEVRVDGEVVGSTPLREPLAVAEGRHRVELRHPGYEVVVVEVDALGGGAAVEATPRWLDPVPREQGAWLTVRTSEPGALSTLDGRRIDADATAPVPPGFHRLRVELGDFVPVEREVELAVGERRELALRLAPTSGHREQYLRGASARRRLWVGLGVSGLVAAAAGGVWFGLTLPALLDANARFDANDAAFRACGVSSCPDGADRYSALRDAAANESHGLLPHVIVGAALLGAGLAALATAAVLAADAPSLDRFERAPTWHIGLGGAGLSLRF